MDSFGNTELSQLTQLSVTQEEIQLIQTQLLKQPRVLSIQSHVVSGYVGNKVAIFTLQTLGFDVDPINTVQFSNHTGYTIFTGQRLAPEQISILMSGLQQNELDKYSHIVTGYAGSPAILLEILKLVQQQKQSNPNIIYACDPVMGDDGKLYVAKEMVNIYKEQVIKYADLLLPNLFEAEVLTDIKINNLETAIEACNKLHQMGPKYIVITSINIDEQILIFASEKIDEQLIKRYSIRINRIPQSFSGTGDMVSALMLSQMYLLTNNFKLAFEKSIAIVQFVLKQSFTQNSQELKLIQSRNQIENPQFIYEATII
eukprot:TRINITY_DN1205_c0_g1_i1.p1 TRINITY_DN1205_c0_g1~~TRINITY_DN1205_c0_g1_i1.p1  ORF type:complete len:315 (-),score=137.30 TRINITY_DN1205_c0_g1_i1:13-957(-)